MSVIETSNLRKTYKDFWHRPVAEALKGIDLRVEAGEVFALIGPNGSGKSTTLKLLLGLLRPTAGSVLILGGKPDSMDVKKRIGYLPELSHLHPFLTPRETLHYYGALFGLSGKEIDARTEQLLEMVDLLKAADRPVGGFSKGMARRVGLAQALINAPDLLILDEPTSGLDPEACRQMKDLVLALRPAGVTVVMTSHLLADVEDVCDRVMILAQGKCQAAGTVSELLRVPDKIQFEVDGLSTEAAAELRRMIEKQIGRTVQQSFPAMSLEAYFLDVVRTDAKREFHPAQFLLQQRK